MGEFIEALTKCPCKNCICVAICRHRPYSSLIDKCQLVMNYLYVTNNPSHEYERAFHNERLQSIVEMINPTTLGIRILANLK